MLFARPGAPPSLSPRAHKECYCESRRGATKQSLPFACETMLPYAAVALGGLFSQLGKEKSHAKSQSSQAHRQLKTSRSAFVTTLRLRVVAREWGNHSVLSVPRVTPLWESCCRRFQTTEPDSRPEKRLS